MDVYHVTSLQKVGLLGYWDKNSPKGKIQKVIKLGMHWSNREQGDNTK